MVVTATNKLPCYDSESDFETECEAAGGTVREDENGDFCKDEGKKYYCGCGRWGLKFDKYTCVNGTIKTK